MRTPYRSSSLLAALATALVAAGCFNPYANLYDPAAMQAQQQQAMADAQGQTDAQMLQQVEEARAQVKGNPGGADEARVLAQRVQALFILGVVERKKLDAEALLGEANAALDAAATAHPDKKAQILASKGMMLVEAKRKDEGVAALRASMDARPTTLACVPLIAALEKDGKLEEIVPLCKKARPNVLDDEDRFTLLDSCLRHSHGGDPAQGLAWAGKADIAFYQAKSQEIEDRNAAHRAEQEAASARMRADFDASRKRDEQERAQRQASPGGGSGGASTYSLRIHNSCSKTVVLFFGDKPKFGSGRTEHLGANNTTSYSGSAPQTVWIIDERENGLSSFVASGSQSMQITSSCTGFSSY